jgi:outer membrane protein TolC
VQPPRRQIYNAGLAFSYDLDLFSGLRRGIEAASADAEAAVAARDLVRINVAAETARAYADVCNGGYQLDVLAQAITLQEKGLELTRVLVKNGRAAPCEADRRQGLLEAARARLPRLAARRENALLRIAALQGRTPRRPILPCSPAAVRWRWRRPCRWAMARPCCGAVPISAWPNAGWPPPRRGSGSKPPRSIPTSGSEPRSVRRVRCADTLSPLTNRYGLGPLISWTLNHRAARARIEAPSRARADLAAFDGTVIKALREVETALNSIRQA